MARDADELSDERSLQRKVHTIAGKRLHYALPPYHTPEFWEERHEASGRPYDWYCTFADVQSLVRRYVHDEDRVLVVGCGSSPFAASLYRDGVRNVKLVDTCEVAIAQQISKYGRWEGMEFEVADATLLPAEADETLDVVIDKCCLDSVLLNTNGVSLVRRMLSNVHRILRGGGRYILISHGEKAVRMPYLEMNGFEVEHIVLRARESHHFYLCVKCAEPHGSTSRNVHVESLRLSLEKMVPTIDELDTEAAEDEKRRLAEKLAWEMEYQRRLEREKRRERRERRRNDLFRAAVAVQSCWRGFLGRREAMAKAAAEANSAP